ncbi:exonuclease subunit SbcC [Staphylococcus warneri]|uniref:exonuclease subunit SbcC n=2 Tax=Staphylococcus TaxID=1279 RepID=UPI001D12E531|nr:MULTISPECIES: exonuclease subunit SbcC [Staphylococcus]MCM3482061.1 SMC family ATPase [Staphylococcus warneri]MCR1796757.1 SMC family ATPase [Staphylococcus warneri]MCR4500367.1 SMC family ATPase [Staphylococcus warneri]MCT1632072.1 SMC family ATPase [Staphylococcus warneri]MCT2348451.1 SMC family ATPase [Staphylococcus warneri]
MMLKLNNFGPFLNETIDFRNIDQNQLFLISGKTGSGKTMIFDAIVYALYGEASTKNRKENDLRSHFADGNSAMQVTFEFELNHKLFKIVRTGPYIKEGNTTKTPAKLNVFEYIENEFDLRESMVNAGNQFIIDLIGVNAEQFRQLFILPQGEFKKFLLSNSKEKQGILRTLFNSERFEEIEKQLNENVKNEKIQIEERYKNIERLWNDLHTFENDELEELKSINVHQTDKIIEVLHRFNEFGKKIGRKKYEQKKNNENEIEKVEQKLSDNKELELNLNELNKSESTLKQLKQKENNINQQRERLNKINEIKPLSQLLDRNEAANKKLNQAEKLIEIVGQEINKLIKEKEENQLELNQLSEQEESINKEKAYLEKTNTFYTNMTLYLNSYKDKERLISQLVDLNENREIIENELLKLNEAIKSKEINYSYVEQLSQDIFNIEKELELAEKLKNDMKIKAELTSKLNDTKTSYNQKCIEIEDLSNKLSEIDKTEINLNNKETLVEQLQQVMSLGDTCPICGNEITSLGQHIDFDSINKKQNLIQSLQKELNEMNIDKAKLESTLNHLTEQINNIHVDENTMPDIKTLYSKINRKKEEKEKQQKENEFILKTNKKVEQKRQESFEIENEIKNAKSKIEQCEIRINDFESTTQYNEIDEFETYFKKLKSNVDHYLKLLENHKQNRNEIIQKLSIEENNLHHHKQTKNDIQEEIKQTQQALDAEMNRLNIDSIEQVQDIIKIVYEKEDIENEIKEYDKQIHKNELEISRLKKLVAGRKLDDIGEIQKTLSELKAKLENVTNEIATLEYQLKLNQQKVDEIVSHIEYLNKELKEQQDIFNLAEILSGKNSQKLTLENYVLIYYLEKIIAQANIRLATMSGQRYQLQRREALSQGFSGLEIDVFDFYSNKARHISSLSGGETFQASLALALGLSEIVQQESGGISLQSMFIDEGFGTLDQETLETALDTLVNLKSKGRMVGIISHVSELKQRIPLILEVTSNQYQSMTKFKWN